MAIEELYSHYDRPRTAILMGHARGVICLAAAQRGVDVAALCGHAHQEDAHRQRSGPQRPDANGDLSRVRFDTTPEPPDVADALAIALCHVHTRDVIGDAEGKKPRSRTTPDNPAD